ncbi:hypothetical protein DQ04_02821070 [Trypanosoma grayi]|uniref:hypothetical protein n=1 Tax=Trypanosoma grayi TaxID=71804 RepID=UPI0004F49ECA|nr:hypothetical protein DQ04_02821070 [Trypanosoma grayi]KEG11245.1 hypothetical protein DQ04_02821070 [Trypanosoma grayi]
MEDDVVQSRCVAIIQQLLCSGEKRLHQKPPPPPHQEQQQQQGLIGTVSKVLRQRAMLLYRLCRAKGEKLAVDQTEDAAYCVLAAVSSCQPSLWAVVTNWSRALRPRSPELRFGAPLPMTVRLKDVEQFIARTAYLQPASNAEDAMVSPAKGGVVDGGGGNRNTSRISTGSITAHRGARKHPREEENSNEAKLDPDLARQLAWSYFQLNTPNTKKLYAVVAAYEKEVGGGKLIEQMEESTTFRTAVPSGRRHTRNSGLAGDESSSAALPATEDGENHDDEDDGMDDGLLAIPTASSSSSGTVVPLQYFAFSMNLTAFADSVESACVAVFYDRLQQCLRSPLLYSPLACMEEANATADGAALLYASAGRPDAAYLLACHNALGSRTASLRSPAHFLHPARARLQSLLPGPLQLVTSQLLWTRLLVVGLWLQTIAQGGHGALADKALLSFCTSVVKAAQRDACCTVCDELVRERPTLRLSALARGEDMTDDGAAMRLWDDMKRISLDTSPTDGVSFCDDLLRCISRRLDRKARELAEAETTGHASNTTALANATTPGNKNGRASTSAPLTSSPTLRELLTEVRCDYPLDACRAALIGGAEGEAAMLSLLRDEHREGESGRGGKHQTAISVKESREVTELLDDVPCIPRLREADAVLECAGCLLLFHQDCVCPVQRDPAEGIFLCHACRLARGPLLLPPLRCSTVPGELESL